MRAGEDRRAAAGRGRDKIVRGVSGHPLPDVDGEAFGRSGGGGAGLEGGVEKIRTRGRSHPMHMGDVGGEFCRATALRQGLRCWRHQGTERGSRLE